MTKISIQGNKGSYSHAAAMHLFGGNIELLECETFKDVFESCENKSSDFSVIPIENSTHGSVFENYDHISRCGFHIIKELYLKVNFHLIGIPGAVFEDITEVHTHPVSLSQIRKFLNDNKQIKGYPNTDNGTAVAMIMKEQNKNKAAAASKLAAQIYGGNIIKENLQDNPKNYTRFIVISREENYSDTSNKTSIQFGIENSAGTLAKTLSTFATNNISLSKIESRPIFNTDWEYLFYVDLEAGLEEERMQKAIIEATESTKDLKILGTYIKGEYIDT